MRGPQARATGLHQALDNHHVPPDAIELAVALIDPDLPEPVRRNQRAAGPVLYENPRQQLPEAGFSRRLNESLQRHSASTASPHPARDVHRRLRDPGIAFAVPIFRAGGECHHFTAVLDYDHRVHTVEPAANVAGRSQACLEGGHAVLDTLVVDAGDGRSVGGTGRARDHGDGYHSRIMKWIAAALLAATLHAAEPSEVTKLLQELIRIDTSNPPGNE